MEKEGNSMADASTWSLSSWKDGTAMKRDWGEFKRGSGKKVRSLDGNILETDSRGLESEKKRKKNSEE